MADSLNFVGLRIWLLGLGSRRGWGGRWGGRFSSICWVSQEGSSREFIHFFVSIDMSWVLCTTTPTFLSWCTHPLFSNFELILLSWGREHVPSSLGSRTVGVTRVQLIMPQLKPLRFFLVYLELLLSFHGVKSLARHFKTQNHSHGPHSQNSPHSRSSALTLHEKHCLDFSFVFSAPLPAYQPWAQISNHGRACTRALLLYKRPLMHCTVSTSQFLCGGDGSQRAICSCSLRSSPSLEDSLFVKTCILYLFVPASSLLGSLFYWPCLPRQGYCV
jgi:hypothetical protein